MDLLRFFRTKEKIFYFIIFNFMLISLLSADEKAVITSEVSDLSTTDHIRQKTLEVNYRNHRRELLYPFKGEAEKAWDIGANLIYIDGSDPTVKYDGLRFLGILGRKISPRFYIEQKFGFHQLENPQAKQTKIIPSFNLSAQFILNHFFSGGVSVNRDFVYQDLLLPAGVSQQLVENSFGSHLNFQWAPRIKSNLRISQHFLSDKNAKSQSNFSTSYGLVLHPHWIWIGVGVEELSFNKEGIGYWSPAKFTSFGPRLEAVWALKENLYFSLAFNGNRFYDKETASWGSGYYSTVKFQYGDRNNFHMALFYIGIDSNQNGGHWGSNQGGLSFSLPF